MPRNDEKANSENTKTALGIIKRMLKKKTKTNTQINSTKNKPITFAYLI